MEGLFVICLIFTVPSQYAVAFLVIGNNKVVIVNSVSPAEAIAGVHCIIKC